MLKGTNIEATLLSKIRYWIMKSFILIIAAVFFIHTGCSSQAKGEIKWMSFEEAIAANKVAPKKIFIDLYTSWCGWCKVMDKNTFSDSTVAAYMNENFYCVKFNAEQKDTIIYNNIKFPYMEQYKAHALAISLLDGNMTYPSFVILTETEKRLKIIKGYQEKDVFLENMKVIANFKDY